MRHRKCQIYQQLCCQKRSFLEAEVWKTVPWQNAAKIFEDRVMDIFVDLPGLAENVASPGNWESVSAKVKVLRAALRMWRWDWHIWYSSTVRSVHVPVPPSGGVNGPDEIRRTALEQMPSVQLKFDSLTQAVEILYYNVALLYLMQLEELASGGVRTPEPPFGNGELKTTQAATNKPE